MTLNLGLPRLRNRAQHETDKATEAASQAAEQARKAAEQAAEQARVAAQQARQAMGDAGQRLGSMDVRNIDLRGALDSVRRTIGDAGKSLSQGTDQVAQGAQQVGQQAGKVGKDLRNTVDEVRQLRITKKRGRDPWPGVALITGVAGGIAAMFLFDPEDGARRRALLRDKLGKWGRVASERARGQAEHVRNVSKGIVHDVRTAIPVGSDQSSEQGSGQPDWASQEAARPSDEPGWPTQEPIGSAAGVETRTPGYSSTPAYGDLSHEPGAPNGREV